MTFISKIFNNGYFIRGTQWIYRIGSVFLLGSIPKLRIGSGAGARQIEVPKGLHWASVVVGEICCEWITPPDAPTDAVLLFLHGGGGVLGLYNSMRKMIGHISSACNLRAFIPDYRLAPENPFPAGLNDCVAAYCSLLSEGFNPQRIVIVGDSAGGYLTIGSLLFLRDNGQPLPAAAVCISPSTDPTCSGKSLKTNILRDALLSPIFVRTMTSLYIDDHDLRNPYISLLTANLRGLPPILIQAGADEVLLDDSRLFSDYALAADVELTLEIWPHMWHDWHSCVPNLSEANQAIGCIAVFVDKHVR